MIPAWPDQAARNRYEIPSSIWSSIRNSQTISEAVCSLLMRKDVFSPMLYPIRNYNVTLPSKYGVLEQFINSDFELGWDHVEKTSVSFGLFEKLYYVCYNIFHFFVCGTTRYENRQDFILLKILESINLEDAFRDRDFLDLSYFLRQKLIKKLRLYPDINYQILARQIIQKIDAVHRQFGQMNRFEQQKCYPGLPPHLSYDRHYMLVHLSVDGMSLQYSPHFQSDPEIVKRAFIQNPYSLQYASKILQSNKEFMLDLIRIHDIAFNYCSETLQKDFDIKKELLLRNGKWLSGLDKESKLNPDLVMAALQSPYFDFAMLAPFAANKDIMLYAYSKNCPLKAIDASLLADKEFTLKAIPLRGWDVYVRCSEELRKDKDVKLAAYKKRYLKKRLHHDEILRLHRTFIDLFNDLEFVLHCLAQDGKYYRYASVSLKKDQSVILQALRSWSHVMYEIPRSISENKEFLVKACKIQGSLIQNVSEDLSHDLDIVHSCLDHDVMNFSYLPLDLQRSSSFLKSIIFKYPQVIYYIDTERLDPEDTLEILKKYGSFYPHMPDVIKQSVPHILAAFSSEPRIINSISPEILRSDPELSRLYILQRLDLTHVSLDDHNFLPLPLPKRSKQIADESAPKEDPQIIKDLVLNPHADLKQFVRDLDFEKMRSLGQGHISARKLQDKKTEYLRAIAEFEDRLIHEKAFIGTPRPTDRHDLKLFWATIRYYISEVGQVLLKDKSLNKERNDLIEAFLVCGGGLLGQLHELFIQLCEAPKNTIQEHLSFKLSKIAESKIGIMNPTQDVHKANMLKWQLEAYIDGPPIVKDFLGYEQDELELMVEFFTHYSPKQICQELAEDLKHDELFQELVESYIENHLMEKFSMTEIVLEAFQHKKDQFIAAKHSLGFYQDRIRQILKHYPNLTPQLFVQGMNVLFRAGDPKVILKTVEMTLREKLNPLQIRAFFESKEALNPLNQYLQTVSLFTGLAKSDIITIKAEDLEIAFEGHLSNLKALCTEEEFSKKYRNKLSLLNPAGMARLLYDLGYLEKFS